MSHDAIASTFDEWARTGRGEGMEKGHGDVVRQVIERLTLRPGHQVLDLGCGVGWATRILAQAAPGVQAIGVDVSPEMIAKAEELSSLRIRARYEVCPFEALDFPDGKFDHVFSMEAIYYSPDLDKALSEVHRVMKPGADINLVVDCYAEREATVGWGEAVGLELNVLGEAEWAERMRKTGFVDVKTERVQDSRGPGEAADFQASACFPSWDAFVEYHEAGSLWISARKGEA